MTSELFKIGAVYSFETFSPPILGEVHSRVTCDGAVSYKLALSKGHPVGTLYRSVYPTLPLGTPDIPELLKYYLFTTPTGSSIVMCEQWIKPETITEVSFVNFSVMFERAEPATIDTVSKLLRGAGLTDFEIQVKT